MQQLLAIGIGGFCGALSRHGFNVLFRKYVEFPWSTFAANMTGCFLMGLMMAFILDRRSTSNLMTDLVVIGFLGSLTTFSSFSFQSLELIQAGRLGAAATNVALNVVIGLSAVWLGMMLARSFSGT